MAAITVLKENVPHGPFTREQVADQLGRGEITLDSLAFIEGLTQWTPLRDVLARVDAVHSPAPLVSALPVATSHSHIPTADTAARIGTGYSYAATMQPPAHLVYAGFWLRFVAVFIDGLVTLPLSVPYYGFYWASRSAETSAGQLAMALGMLGSWVFLVIGRWLYFSLQESSRYQATLGKRAMGIYVTTRSGDRIGFGRATGRYFGKIVSALTLTIGFMMAGWTQRKQALHDMLADTLVVRKPGV